MSRQQTQYIQFFKIFDTFIVFSGDACTNTVSDVVFSLNVNLSIMSLCLNNRSCVFYKDSAKGSRALVIGSKSDRLVDILGYYPLG